MKKYINKIICYRTQKVFNHFQKSILAVEISAVKVTDLHHFSNAATIL